MTAVHVDLGIFARILALHRSVYPLCLTESPLAATVVATGAENAVTAICLQMVQVLVALTRLGLETVPT